MSDEEAVHRVDNRFGRTGGDGGVRLDTGDGDTQGDSIGTMFAFMRAGASEVVIAEGLIVGALVSRLVRRE